MLLLAEHIIPVTSEPIDDGAVLVRDGRIVEIGGAQRMKSRYPQEEVRDFGQSAIMPGFVDCHTHLEYTVLRGIVHDVPYAEWLAMEHAKADMMSRDDRYDSALVGCMEMLSGGVTTVADFTSTGASCEAVNDMGLRSVVYRSVGAPEKAKVDSAIEAAVNDVRSWREASDADRVTIGIAPKALHACHPTVFSKVNAIAEEMGLPVAMHVAGSYEELRYIRDGATPLSVRGISGGNDSLTDRPMWLPTGVTPVNYALNWNAFNSKDVLAVHCVHVDDMDISKLKEHDVAIAVCTRCNAQLGMGLAPLHKFLQAGIRVGLGTDSPAATDSADMFTEMRLGMLIHRAVYSDAVLSAATMLEPPTIGGARAMAMDDEPGGL
ncbi:amidohydrolase family protein, partial [uncultured Slackia sp.]|uniref:amidohydrolase family protein n=1 Tax=uncultured Slackia sp. TaxID=665903 RepID=UPI0025F0BAB4